MNRPSNWRATWVDQYAELQSLIQNGMSVVLAARQLGRTRDAIYEAVFRHGDTIAALRGATYRTRSLNQVAALFGVSHPVVRGWVAQRWLAASRNGTRKRKGSKKPAHYLVNDLALMDFIARRESWPAWTAEKITDDQWRAAALEERAAAGGHWTRAVDVLARQHYATNDVGRFIRAKRLEATKIRNVWYVWENERGSHGREISQKVL